MGEGQRERGYERHERAACLLLQVRVATHSLIRDGKRLRELQEPKNDCPTKMPCAPHLRPLRLRARGPIMNLNFSSGSGASRDPGLTPAEMRHASAGCLIGERRMESDSEQLQCSPTKPPCIRPFPCFVDPVPVRHHDLVLVSSPFHSVALRERIASSRSPLPFISCGFPISTMTSTPKSTAAATGDQKGRRKDIDAASIIANYGTKST